MKYDRDGNPLKQPTLDPMNQPAYVETTAGKPVEAPAQQMVENQGTSEQEMVQNQPNDVDQTPLEQLNEQPEQQVASQPEAEPAPEEPEKPKRSHQASNFKIMKEKALAAEKRAQELEAALAQAMNAQPKQVQQEPEIDEDLSVDADALVEGKHLSKVSKHIKKLENQLQQYQQQSVLQATEVRLKTQYPDFDKIVSKENLESLRMTYPEIANTINSSPDLYSKAVSAYTIIKNLGLTEDTTDYSKEKELVRQNAAKPKPSAVLNVRKNDGPLSNANAFANGELTEDMRKMYLKEMNQFRNR